MSAGQRHEPAVLSPPKTYHFVLDDDDRITYVWPELGNAMAPFVGRLIWELLPGAEGLLRHPFDDARRTRREIRFTTFYAGRFNSIRAMPAADGLAVHVEQLGSLNVRTLSTLAESLRRIEAELVARES
jgi:hypothetical protein